MHQPQSLNQFGAVVQSFNRHRYLPAISSCQRLELALAFNCCQRFWSSCAKANDYLAGHGRKGFCILREIVSRRWTRVTVCVGNTNAEETDRDQTHHDQRERQPQSERCFLYAGELHRELVKED